MLSQKQIILELECIQNTIDKNFVPKQTTLREVIDNLRITVSYQTLDIESLRRELEIAEKQ